MPHPRHNATSTNARSALSVTFALLKKAAVSSALGDLGRDGAAQVQNFYVRLYSYEHVYLLFWCGNKSPALNDPAGPDPDLQTGHHAPLYPNINGDDIENIHPTQQLGEPSTICIHTLYI